MANQKLGFNLEWFESASNTLHKMQLVFYCSDGTIEIMENGRLFLKRISFPLITINGLFLGNSFSLYHRIITIKSYANVSTEAFMRDRERHIFCCIRNKNDVNDIASFASSLNFFLSRAKTAGNSTLSGSGISISTGDYLLEFVGLDGDRSCRILLDKCSEFSSSSCQILSFDEISNILREVTCYYPKSISTLCLIKPHILKSFRAGELMKAIAQAGFNIVSLSSIHLSLPMAEELFECYKTIYPSYSQSVEEICSGTSLALMIEGHISIVEEFREFCGPLEPEIAKLLRPNSLRAKFGINSIQNAVHCTDLPEDGDMECKYIFHTLSALF